MSRTHSGAISPVGAYEVKTVKYRPKPADEISRNMRAIRSTDNKTEAKLRRALHACGLRYRLYNKELPGKPDMVFMREKVAVFVDGDYWHARLLREKGRRAFRATLRTPTWHYWLEKFTRRVERDDAVTALLRRDGWLVIRFWESDIKSDVTPAVRRVVVALKRRRRSKRRPRKQANRDRPLKSPKSSQRSERAH